MKKGIIQIFFSNVIFLIFGALTNFILPKYLSIESYSTLKTYVLYTSYAAILSFGYIEGMFIKYGGKSVSETYDLGFKRNAITFWIFQSAIMIILIIVGVIIKNLMLIACSIGFFAINICNYYKNYATATGDFKPYSIMTSMEKTMIFVLNALFIFAFKIDNPYYYILIVIFVSLFEIILYTVVLKIRGNGKQYKLDFSLLEIKNCISLGLILMFGNLISNLFTGIDQWFVKILMDDHSFAMYAFSVSLEKMIVLFISPISAVMYSYFCRKNDATTIKSIQEKVLIWSIVLLASVYPMKFIVFQFLPKYIESIPISSILLIAEAFNCLISCIYINIYKAKKMQKAFLINIIEITIVSIVMNAILFYFFKNMISIAIGTLITKFIWLFLCEFKMKEYRLSIKDHIIISFLVIFVILTCNYINAFIGFGLFIILLALVVILFYRKSFKELLLIVKPNNSNNYAE